MVQTFSLSRQNNGHLTRDCILDAALELIATLGLRRFSVAELARGLGVVKSALYHHFPGGKGDLVNGVFDRVEGRLLEEGRAAAARASGTRAKLEAMARVKVAQIAALGRLYRVSEEIVDEVEGFLVARRRSFLERERAALGEVLAAGVERGEVSVRNVRLVAVALQGALQQVMRAVALEHTAPRDDAASELIGILFEGIGGTQ